MKQYGEYIGVRKDADATYAVVHLPSGKPAMYGIARARDANELGAQLAALGLDLSPAVLPHDVLVALFHCVKAWLAACEGRPATRPPSGRPRALRVGR